MSLEPTPGMVAETQALTDSARLHAEIEIRQAGFTSEAAVTLLTDVWMMGYRAAMMDATRLAQEAE